MNHGYPVGNFSISGSIDPDGSLFSSLQVNPGNLGQHLCRYSCTELMMSRSRHQHRRNQIKYANVALRPRDCEFKRVERQWPISTVELADPAMGDLMVSFTSFAPLELGDSGKQSSLPVLMIRVKVRNRGNEPINDFELQWESPASESESWYSGWYQGGQPVKPELVVSPGESLELWLIIAHYDPMRSMDQFYKNAQSIAEHAADRVEDLLIQTRLFEKALPSTGDPTLDQSLRWNATAAVYLTKITRNNEVVTMGYKELNQRDSYWTSFIHVLLWPELDRRMIEQSIAAQKENGKIPTCILPEIDREIDIDINAYFVLRVTRYLAIHHDMDFASQCWPAINAAIEFLYTLDDESIGLPYQRTYWGDWKDVPGVSERKYAPHACLIVIAAMKEASAVAEWIGHVDDARSISNKADAGLNQLNKHIESGGLWNGQYYQQIWQDERNDPALLEDQVIAGLFGIIPPERLKRIFQSLDRHASGPMGVSETWPWYSENYGYQPGHYHNGGIWPWLSYADAWCRLAYGDAEEAIQILKRVAWADLEKMGDWQPHEYIAADKGENHGPPIQGWTAAYVGAIAWGMRGLPIPTFQQFNQDET